MMSATLSPGFTPMKAMTCGPFSAGSVSASCGGFGAAACWASAGTAAVASARLSAMAPMRIRVMDPSLWTGLGPAGADVTAAGRPVLEDDLAVRDPTQGVHEKRRLQRGDPGLEALRRIAGLHRHGGLGDDRA